MGTLTLIIQIVAITTGVLAIGLLTKANLVIMKFRQLSTWGLLELWTGSINTRQLIIMDGKNNKVVEKEVVKAIVLYKRARLIGYLCLGLNVIALLLHA
ncbi:hypothetical protein ACFQ3S_11315 [Mucilaginibacter terrae]|uniref:hypothetical protein n=1 Tax=Mucilaginibacter terrae TaxID=1955052 RepID=UPI003634293C